MVIGLMVDTHDKHRSILGGSADDNLLGTALQVLASSGNVGEDTSGVYHDISVVAAPWNLLGLHAGGKKDRSVMPAT